jgi:hypothetical protein
VRKSERYSFISSDPTLGEASFRPYLPLSLVLQQTSIVASALLDTGASVNVMPYTIGDAQRVPFQSRLVVFDTPDNRIKILVVMQKKNEKRIGRSNPLFQSDRSVRLPEVARFNLSALEIGIMS